MNKFNPQKSMVRKAFITVVALSAAVSVVDSGRAQSYSNAVMALNPVA
jgi:hypothetical protein